MHRQLRLAMVKLHNVDNSCIMWITLWIKSLVVSSLSVKIVDIVSFAGLVDNNVDNSAAEVASRAAERAALPAWRAAAPSWQRRRAPANAAEPCAKLSCVELTLALCTTATSAAWAAMLAVCRAARRAKPGRPPAGFGRDFEAFPRICATKFRQLGSLREPLTLTNATYTARSGLRDATAKSATSGMRSE